MSRAQYGPDGWTPPPPTVPQRASTVHIQAVQMSPEEMTVAFAVEPDDLRMGGAVAQARQFSIARDHDNYRRRIDEIEEMLKEVVVEAVSDFNNSDVYVPPSEVSEDQLEMGLGYDT